MKKLFILVILFLFPINVIAEGTDKYYIEANILANGDMQVKELKILDGSYNGVENILSYKSDAVKTFTGIPQDFEGSTIYNASNIENIKVYGLKYQNKNDFNIIHSTSKTEFTQQINANLGDYGVYTQEGYTIRSYMPSSYNEASLITYTLKDVVVIHNDIAEIAWDFIGKNYNELIGELVIVINLPDNSNELRVFSHGPLDGNNSIVSKNQVKANYYYVNPYQAIDVRVVFDKSLVSFGTKLSNIDGLANILAVEKILADKANEIREETCDYNCDFDQDGICDLNCDTNHDQKCDLNCDTNRDRVCDVNCDTNKDGVCDQKCYPKQAFIAGIITGISLIIAIIYYYIKHDKELKKNFTSKYYREFIDDYNVEIIDYIMKSQITPNAMSASIMNLVYKKIIKVDKQETNKKSIKSQDLYVFTKISDSPNKTEQILLNFLFNKVGDGLTFTDQSLKKYASGSKSYSDFLSSYTGWKNTVIEEGKRMGFWQSNKQKVLYCLYIILSSIIFGYFIFISQGLANPILGTGLFIGHFVALVYVVSSKKRTPKGHDHYQKWNAFKNFLDDFGSFEHKDLPEIILWERYLVYATIFGLADKVQKTMNVKIKEFSYNEQAMVPNLFDYMLLNNVINRSVTNAISSATQAAAVQAASAVSSSGGFGGGSSFGGGGFGGGGSGGGRF